MLIGDYRVTHEPLLGVPEELLVSERVLKAVIAVAQPVTAPP